MRDVNTDKIVTAICKESLYINLSEDDISRSHIIGKPNSRGNIQIKCKLKNWKIKNTVHQSQKKLNNSSLFITEDLTRYRQQIKKAKKAKKVHSFWTNDGRIFAKLSERGNKFMIRSLEDLRDLEPPQPSE